ncbi:hypothetical protein [Halomicrobium salinisoli]|uniref:hypothetical protein n=1 Tax=Halomicrobium salinisoli TaxID=2878391 RepID=UPI001CF081A8|nr:hypothetical protein [Halomicrobium salinisoli]
MTMPDEAGEGDNRRRRLLLLLLVAALVAIGTGVGGLELTDGPGSDPPTVDVTPVPTDRSPGETPTATAVPTPGETASGTTDRPTPSETATATGTVTSDSPTAGTSTSERATTEARGGDADEDDGDGSGSPDTDTATPTPAITEGTGEDDAGDGGAGDGVSLAVEGSAAFVQLSGAEPGSEGRGRVRVRNAGDAAGRLAVAAVTVEDRENGIVEPERAVDDSPDEGELSEHLRIALLAGDGETAVIGTGSDPVPLAAAASSDEPFRGPRLGSGEATTLVLRWRLPAETGNEVQSDGVAVTFEFRLRTTG